MQQIVNFLIRNKTFITFLLLFCISLLLTIKSHSYQQTKFLNSANWVSGGIYSTSNSISDYFHLKKYNKQLVDENLRLRKILMNREIEVSDSILELDSLAHYKLYGTSVIKNSYNKPRNYILINKGSNDSIKEDMGVITSKGIVGIVENTSSNYANVQSVLNSLSGINASIKNSNNFGSLKWDGKDFRTVQLMDILRAAPIKKGDTIITGGMSSIFPKGILIGTIEDFSLDISENYYLIDVKLFNDMTTLDHVYVIKNLNKEEILTLENGTNE
ncbi:rod shape-determining protein MreC [Galbibacter sp. EGI 63066]|uniref:rod shape-determining protein MreC n=1 Tax=Galbibacter sp. EGI 63066 TaxID=2993559 RepID=UPI0022499F4B|nr:rod shape-determining protein MreC [Galbibacter sp. EGI 63066]MCX2679969.1 rod shape-determining protein MreC [Galbibacter sp. EGI 63066]